MHRIAAALIALAAILSLVLQARALWMTLGDTATVTLMFWTLSGFFTVLTDLAIAVVFGWSARSGWPVPPVLAGAMTVAILMVAIVYQIAVAPLWNPEDMHWWADQALHGLLPVLVVLWWLILADKHGLTMAAPLAWLIWPALFAGYSLARGALTGSSAYPFLDVAAIGWGGVIGKLAFFTAGLLLVGLAMLAIAKTILLIAPGPRLTKG